MFLFYASSYYFVTSHDISRALTVAGVFSPILASLLVDLSLLVFVIFLSAWPVSQNIFPGIVLPTSINVMVSYQDMSVDDAADQFSIKTVGARTTQMTNSSTKISEAPVFL